MKPPLFRYQAPRTLKEAVVALASDPDAMVLAGGQSLLPAMNFRLANPSLLVDIQHVAELKGIAIEGGQIIVKAMTRHREPGREEGVPAPNPPLTEAMAHAPHPPMRTRGPGGGSLCLAGGGG